MRFIPALLLAVSLCMTQGCFGLRAAHKQIESITQQLKVAEDDNSFLQKHPVIKTKEVTKIIEDTSKQMAWFKFIGILLIGVGIGITVLGAVWRI